MVQHHLWMHDRCSHPGASRAHTCNIICNAPRAMDKTYSRSRSSRVANTLHHGDFLRAAKSYGHANKAPWMSSKENPIPGASSLSRSTIGRIYRFAHFWAVYVYASINNATEHTTCDENLPLWRDRQLVSDKIPKVQARRPDP